MSSQSMTLYKTRDFILSNVIKMSDNKEDKRYICYSCSSGCIKENNVRKHANSKKHRKNTMDMMDICFKRKMDILTYMYKYLYRKSYMAKRKKDFLDGKKINFGLVKMYKGTKEQTPISHYAKSIDLTLYRHIIEGVNMGENGYMYHFKRTEGSYYFENTLAIKFLCFLYCTSRRARWWPYFCDGIYSMLYMKKPDDLDAEASGDFYCSYDNSDTDASDSDSGYEQA